MGESQGSGEFFFSLDPGVKLSRQIIGHGTGITSRGILQCSCKTLPEFMFARIECVK